jgi:putative ABC transport system permease protein
MIKNYFKIAWRNIIKSRFYSTINIIGLSAGIAFTIVITAYVWSEMKVNADLKNAGNQYIIQSKWKDPAEGVEGTSMGPMAKWLKEKYPSLVQNYFRFDGVTSNISKGEKVFRESIQIGDSTLLDMYGFSLLHGNPSVALNGPFKVVLTEDKAIKYFGKTDVVGQTITIQNFSGSQHDFIITGVMKTPYKNSVTNINEYNNNHFYISNDNLDYFGRNMGWGNQSIVNYIELKPGVNPESIIKPMQLLLKQNASALIAQDLTPYLVPLKDYYLNANNQLVRKLLVALSVIAFFILLMAVINFINMSVSRAATRMKEIGIRKVLGGLKTQLIIQFLVESTMIVFIATLFALISYEATKDIFSFILGISLPTLLSFPFYFIIFPFLLIMITGILAGTYPALVLSSLRSVESLKGKLSAVKENVLLRKSLVAFQFATAAIVFISAIIISQQVNHFFSKDLGYDKNYIVSSQLPRNWTQEGVQKMANIRNRFAAMPQVSNVTLSYSVPDGYGIGSTFQWKKGADSASGVMSQMLFTDEYYAATYGIPVIAGTFFGPPGAVTDSFAVVINETQAAMFGWKNPKDAIGRQIIYETGAPPATIAGVVKDFHFGSMEQQIKPITFIHVGLTQTFRFLSFKIKPGNISNTVAALQKEWSALMPGSAFDYKFMDEILEKVYRSELQLKQAAYTGVILALMIVLLGVFGLISLSVQKRIKEIGIRKVLGSSVAGIISLFMKEFVSVILIASVISCPVAYILMNTWLNCYTYRVAITVQPFFTATILLGLITALLITVQTFKTAMDNPVKSLKTE